MTGYWVGITTNHDVETLQMMRVSARRLDNICDQLRKDRDENGTAFNVDAWYSKDVQTSGEAPMFTVTSGGDGR